MKKLILILHALILYWMASAQQGKFEKKLFISGTDTLRYCVLSPIKIEPRKKYPVVLFLHGSGERGSDNELQLVHGGSLFADSANRKKYPAFVIFPQCPYNQRWANINLLKDSSNKKFNVETLQQITTPLRLVAQLVDSFSAMKTVDANEIYIGGLSMGGMGTFEMLWRKPHFFAAAFPICGAGDTSKAKIYGKNFPIWVFHGDADPAVNVMYSRLMVNALKNAEARVKYSEYPGVGHNSWDNAFREPELLSWLFSQHK